MIKIIYKIYCIGSHLSLALKMLLSWILKKIFRIHDKNMPDNEIEGNPAFFPKDWSKSKIRKKLREAYKDGMSNPEKQDQNFGLLGHTSEGIPIRFWFEKKMVIKTIDGKNIQEPVYFISSVYPLMKPLVNP